MKYRVIVDVFCDKQEHGHAFAEKVVELIDDAFNKWPERSIGLYTHTAPMTFTDGSTPGTPESAESIHPVGEPDKLLVGRR